MFSSVVSVGEVSAFRACIVLGLSFTVAGCGTPPPPNAEIRAAELAVEEAREAKAVNYAAGPYALAQDKLARARDAFEEEEYDAARRLAEQAELDAQLAEAQARTGAARERVSELRESIRILREEIGRRGNT